MYRDPEQYVLADNGIFPNSAFPVLYYRKALKLPWLFATTAAERLLQQNGWTNSWRDGIYTFHHYHSNTHEVMAVYKGGTIVRLGGDTGLELRLSRGDVLVIPAGVAHKNMGRRNQLGCVGAYPGGLSFDMNYGAPGERPAADLRIASVPLPLKDPVSGSVQQGLPAIWRNIARQMAHRYPGGK